MLRSYTLTVSDRSNLICCYLENYNEPREQCLTCLKPNPSLTVFYLRDENGVDLWIVLEILEDLHSLTL